MKKDFNEIIIEVINIDANSAIACSGFGKDGYINEDDEENLA